MFLIQRQTIYLYVACHLITMCMHLPRNVTSETFQDTQTYMPKSDVVDGVLDNCLIVYWNIQFLQNRHSGDTFSLFLSIFYISQRLTLWYFVFLYLIFLSQQVLYFLLSTLVLTLYIDVVLSLSIKYSHFHTSLIIMISYTVNTFFRSSPSVGTSGVWKLIRVHVILRSTT